MRLDVPLVTERRAVPHVHWRDTFDLFWFDVYMYEKMKKVVIYIAVDMILNSVHALVPGEPDVACSQIQISPRPSLRYYFKENK